MCADWRIDADDQIQLVDDHRQVPKVAELRRQILHLNVRRKIGEILTASLPFANCKK